MFRRLVQLKPSLHRTTRLFTKAHPTAQFKHSTHTVLHSEIKATPHLEEKNSSREYHKQDSHTYNRLAYMMGMATSVLVAGYATVRSIKEADEAKPLNDVLKKYQDTYKSNPAILINSIAPTQFWRFLMDGEDQHTGMLGYDVNERGYIRAMSHAFPEIFSPTEDLMGLIKKLHLLATTNVENLYYNKNATDAPGEFRKNMVSRVGNLEHVMSTSGMDELLLKIKNIKPNDNWVLFLELSDKKNNTTYILPDEFSHEEKDYLHVSLATRKTLYDILGNGGRALISMQAVNDHSETHERKTITQALNTHMEKLIAKYNYQINRDVTKIAKLKTIIAFTQDCELKHPFRDANTRTFSMLLRNHLLMQNGFPPVIDDNPNRVYAYSRNELLYYVVEGMNRTLLLAEGIEPYKPTTNDLIRKLSSEQKSYFYATVDKLRQFQTKIKPLADSEQKQTQRNAYRP
jgi:hypothetical protein